MQHIIFGGTGKLDEPAQAAFFAPVHFCRLWVPIGLRPAVDFPQWEWPRLIIPWRQFSFASTHGNRSQGIRSGMAWKDPIPMKGSFLLFVSRRSSGGSLKTLLPTFKVPRTFPGCFAPIFVAMSRTAIESLYVSCKQSLEQEN